MQKGKFNILLDGFWGSSGKGKMSTWLADRFNITNVSSSNFPNAGHTARFSDGTTFVAKAIPTAAILKKIKGIGVTCWISPGSGFSWDRLVLEWAQAGKPRIYIHGRASIITMEHSRREREGIESTRHLASTMQGSGTALSDKILRKADCTLARNDCAEMKKAFGNQDEENRVSVIDSALFRDLTWAELYDNGNTWLHEGSQGYALSIDHGSHYPFCTSRNCTSQMAMDQMAMPPSMVGDVYLNLRTFPIRVGNVVNDEGIQVGYSGGFYPDCKELTWKQIATNSGMPKEEAKSLTERERTTVTKRIRRVSTFSYDECRKAARVNGATRLILNFVQYLNWSDYKLRGGRDAFMKLSKQTRTMIDKIEKTSNVPVSLIGTGPSHEDIISLI